MYISTIRKGDDVLVWERRNKNERELKTYRAPYYFYVKHNKGKHETIYGDKAAKLTFNTYSEYQNGIRDARDHGFEIYESDISPALRILSEEYYEAEVPKLNISFYDIEVDFDPQIGFANAYNPYAPINSVAIYHRYSNRNVVLAVPPKESSYSSGEAPEEFWKQLNDVCPLPQEFDNEIIFCKDEKDLLMRFLVEIDNSDIVCGWNSDIFDMPYIGKRLERLGKKFFNHLSFQDANPPRWRTVEIMKKENLVLDLTGRISADYMVLFKKYEMEERPTYKLEAIADEFLPELPKLEYEGSLAELYRNNFAHFVRYNIRDTEILEGFEQKLGYVELANEMYHLSTGTFEHVTGTLKLAELATINYCHHELDKIVNDIDRSEDANGKIQGAYVLLPQVGLHEYIGSIDIASLYPSAIRSINISPETLRGQFQEFERATDAISKGTDEELALRIETKIPNDSFLKKWENEIVTKPAIEWKQLFLENKLAVSGFGTVFDQTIPGIIPTILSKWYNTRKIYKKKKANAKTKQEADYYDRLQYVYKIKLNSFYGALTNKFFRFFDVRMGESTTGTGRMILQHQCAEATKLIDGEYKHPNKSEIDKNGKTHWGYTENYSVIYGDTDSTYFKIPVTNPQYAVKVANEIGELVNQSFKPFMQKTFLCHKGYDDIISAEREIVSDKGIFVDKKRYILHITDDEGKTVDKLKVMGLDTKKTTLPKNVSKTLNEFVERFLKGEKWDKVAEDIVNYKDEMKKSDIINIGLPKGIKGIEEYYREYKTYGEQTRLPGHVAAGIFYNLCREEYDDKVSIPIVSGMKIKVFYLSKKFGKFKSIALPVDIEQIPEWFYQMPFDRDANIYRLVDKPLGNIIKAIGKEVPTHQSLYVDSILEF